MLIRLFGENFRSLKAPFELSMVAADLRRKEDSSRGVVEVSISGMDEPLQLLRTVAIYGPNASGKSTVLTAASVLRWLVMNSSAQAKPDSRIPCYDPFLLDAESAKRPVELGCDVTHNASVLRYQVRFMAEEILEETLTLMNQDSETALIDRKQGKIVGTLIAESEANRLYVKGMQPNVTVLSKLAQHGPREGGESVLPYYRAVLQATCLEDYMVAGATRIHPKPDRFADNPTYREWIMRHLMCKADVGICDAITHREPLEIPSHVRSEVQRLTGTSIPDDQVVVSFLHQGAVIRPIDFENESSGTKKLFNLSADWWRLANESVTILADELCASLHPRLLDQLIRAVNDFSSSVESQLIFATNDTGLLEGHDGKPAALRRDQVYFTRKNVRGESELYSLAEFKDDARPVHNIRKRYLSGLYGALPSVENLSL